MLPGEARCSYMETVLADLITRCELRKINVQLKRTKAMKMGIKRVHEEECTQQQMRKSLT